MKDFETEEPTTLFDTWEEEHGHLENCKDAKMVQSLRETFGFELSDLKQSSGHHTFHHRINTQDQYRYTGRAWEKLPPKWNSWYYYENHIIKGRKNPKMVQALRDTFDLNFNDLGLNGKYFTDGDTFLEYKDEVWTKFPRPVVKDRINLGIARL